MECLSSSHAKHSIGYHVIFCPKFRNTVFHEPMATSLKNILHQTAVHYGWIIHALEIMPGHVHIFVQSDHTTAPMVIAKTLKSISAVDLFNRYSHLKQRSFWGSGLWSKGTFYSTVGHVSKEVVQKYIADQKLRDSSHRTRRWVSSRKS